MKTYRIYLITNDFTGLRYVGQTVSDLKSRLTSHLSHAKNGHRGCPHLHAAMRVYGRDHFQIELLSEHQSLEEANAAEVAAISCKGTLHPHGYNLHEGGRSDFKTSPKSIEALIAANKARAGKPFTEEHIRNMKLAFANRPKRPKKPKPPPNPKGTSGYLGVTFCKRSQKWKAVHHTSKDYTFIGTFDTVEEAAEARKVFMETGALPPRRKTGPKPKPKPTFPVEGVVSLPDPI